MGRDTKIEWAHHTLNFWTGCAKVSPECDKCYAESWAKLTAHAPRPVLWGEDQERRITRPAVWQEARRWNQDARQRGVRERVFVNSLSDFFEDRRDLDPVRQSALEVLRECENLDFLLLTKRENALEAICSVLFGGVWSDKGGGENVTLSLSIARNLWFGVTAGTQKTFDRRWRALELFQRRHSPACTFLSVEPILEEIDLCPLFSSLPSLPAWVIVGGESGNSRAGVTARPTRLEWIERIIDQCAEFRVPVFVKQIGSKPCRMRQGACQNYPITDLKGGNPDEWPVWLRKRELPLIACNPAPTGESHHVRSEPYAVRHTDNLRHRKHKNLQPFLPFGGEQSPSV